MADKLQNTNQSADLRWQYVHSNPCFLVDKPGQIFDFKKRYQKRP
jgi:hypothetical protein